ncbi:hypothetical protein OAT09_02095 [Alphaproteobacteria bacterium]|jgi:hypothetical protein|nr:hypothetical protein [Alphaproteobacteria bacterium]
MIEYQDDLNRLELLSVEISDLVSTNNFEKILELDLERQKIIHKISNTIPLSSKSKITEIVNINNTSINRIEDKMKNLSVNNNKLNKRINFYSLTK